MARTYSYDPSKLGEMGMDRMRFELGDTTFAPGELTAALCDEEYTAIISETSRWKKAKIKCLEAILMRFAHQVNTSIDGISYSFAERVKFWDELLKEEKKTGSIGIPTAAPSSINGDPYFYADMHKNPNVGCHPLDRKGR